MRRQNIWHTDNTLFYETNGSVLEPARFGWEGWMRGRYVPFRRDMRYRDNEPRIGLLRFTERATS